MVVPYRPERSLLASPMASQVDVRAYLLQTTLGVLEAVARYSPVTAIQAFLSAP